MSGGAPPSDGVGGTGDDHHVEGHLSIEDAAGFLAFRLIGDEIWQFLVDEDISVQDAEEQGWEELPPTPKRDRLDEMRRRILDAWWEGQVSFWGWKHFGWSEIPRSKSMTHERVEFRLGENRQVHLYRRLSSSKHKPPEWPWKLAERNLRVAIADLLRLERGDPKAAPADRKPGRPSLCEKFDGAIDAALSADPSLTATTLASRLLNDAGRRRTDLPRRETLADHIRARRRASRKTPEQ